MDEQNRSLPDSSADPNQISGEVSAFHSAWEIEAQARRKAELAERERQKKEAEAQYQAREEYAKTLADEKVDLIRLKQGVITVDELNLPEEEEKHYTVWQKIGNWFYHAKWWLGIAVFCVLVGAFLIYDYVTRVDADVRVLLLTDQQGFYTGSEKLNEILSGLVADCNGDGRQIVQSTYIPVNSDNMEHAGTYSMSYNSQLLIQFQSATSMLVIADADAEAYLRPEEMFEDMQALYPDCPFAEGVHIWLKDTDLPQKLGIETPLKESTYLTLRRVTENMQSTEDNQRAHDDAKALLDAFVPTLQAAAGKENANG